MLGKSEGEGQDDGESESVDENECEDVSVEIFWWDDNKHTTSLILKGSMGSDREIRQTQEKE